MNDAVFIFTFSPIQPFISEARRTADLAAGSKILVELARAAVLSLQREGADLVYPADLSDDIPNKIAALVEWQRIDSIADTVQKAFTEKWEEIAGTAKAFLARKEPKPDGTWEKIWQRQSRNCWEIYWAGAAIPSQDGYAAAYRQAEKALSSRKRCRAFNQCHEEGLKDTLSGRRQALRTASHDASAYWSEIAHSLIAADLRGGGRERLDTLGAVKRFSRLAEQMGFPSTSSVACKPVLLNLGKHPGCARNYVAELKKILGSRLYKTQGGDAAWEYDGDLLYLETLAPKDLEESYGVSGLKDDDLKFAREELKKIHSLCGEPLKYYAILALDGDSMGARVSNCLKAADPIAAYRQLSRSLAQFAAAVQTQAQAGVYRLDVVYNGGDDVLALLPLPDAFDFYLKLAEQFQKLTGGTVSAGMAVVHHTYPLSAALEAARQAESRAKRCNGDKKDAICVRVLKRSGETVEITSPRDALTLSGGSNRFNYLVNLFTGKPAALSNRLAYELLGAAYALPQVDEMFLAELNRLVGRHLDKHAKNAPAKAEIVQRLFEWAGLLPGGSEELGKWLVYARFVAAGGGE